MNKKILVCIIMVAIVITGVLSFVFSTSSPSNLKLGSNSTVIVPSPPKHYTLELKDTAGASAHP